MAEEFERLEPENVAKLAEGIFGMPVERVTAPGGKSRESIRVHFENRSIVATQRKYRGRMQMEAEVLRRLTLEGAPVPKFLHGQDQIFFQEDVGSARLSAALNRASDMDAKGLLRRTFQSLQDIRVAGEAAKLADIVPGLGGGRDWVAGLVGTPHSLSKSLRISEPAIAAEDVVDALVVNPTVFLKWDARPGNASIGDNGRVFWFDWEHCGKRQGMEDYAWLSGDEFFPFGSDLVLEILAEVIPAERQTVDLRYLGLFITFHIVQRLGLIRRRYDKDGWVDTDKAMRFDKIGVGADLARRLCKHGQGWADRDVLTRPMVAWFQSAADEVDNWKRRIPKKN